MEDIIIKDKQNNFATQTLADGQVLEYAPQVENLFEPEISDLLSSNIFITRWDWLGVSLKIQPELQPEQSDNIKDEREVLELEKKYFEANKKDLLEKYKGKYSAILNNKIVGSGKDFSKLAERMYKKFGYQTIYMPFVSTQKRVVRIPSPRVKNF